MDHPRPGLRYIDAGDLDGSFKFDGLDVESYMEEKLGSVDGFIIDVNSGRPYYIVVDASGWFTSKYFLLPIGHAGLDVPDNTLIADISKDHVARYPGFDKGLFEKLSSRELDRLDREMIKTCCPEEAADNDADFSQRYEIWKHYQNATWWDSSFYRPDRFDTSVASASIPASRSSNSSREERVTARESKDADRHLGDVSPHLGGRAQPGDLLGVETGGEQTHIGETSDDENERRRDAEKTAARRDRD